MRSLQSLAIALGLIGQLAVCDELSPSATLRHKHRAVLNRTYSGWVNRLNSSSFVYNWTGLGEIAPLRLFVEAPTSTQEPNWPLVVVAKQGSLVLTQTLPFSFTEQWRANAYGHDVVVTQYSNLARTLCPVDALQCNQTQGVNEATVELSSFSNVPIHFTLFGSLVDDFVLRLDANLTVAVKPSMPQYYWFNFSENEALLDGATAVRLVVRSNDPKACLMMAVQASRCPAWDTPETVDHSGLHQTVLASGDIYVSKAEFPAFFVVLLSYPSNRTCRRNFDPPTEDFSFYNGSKHLTITIIKAPETNILLVTATMTVLAAFVLGSFGLALYVYRYRMSEPAEQEAVDDDDMASIESIASHQFMSVAQLSLNAVDAQAYTMQLLVIGAFYSLPAIQLMLVLNKSIYTTGDLDTCFYNYACSVKQKLAGVEIYAFNNVFSNIGYLASGLAFLLICAVKQYRTDSNCQTGVPDCFSLYYACGGAVVMEGVMSATYHVCPSQYNFQFDTAFMIMLSGLLTLLLYSKRHPDANATAHIAYLALGAFILANTLGILFAERAAKVIYPILGILHLVLTVWIACQVYYFGELNLRDLLTLRGPRNFAYPSHRCTGSGLIARLCCCQPRYPRTLVFLLLAVALNFSAAGVCVARATGRLDFGLQFSEFFLGIMIMNFLLYLLFYMTMKALKVKRTDYRCVSLVTALLLVAALLSGVALYFFTNPPTNWMESPAESRVHNSECLVLGEYDKHDLWHFLSAGALFSLLMLILCADGNDDGKKRDELEVF